MLRAHKDLLVDIHTPVKDVVSYSIKLGNQVPDNSVNLAFFSKPNIIGYSADEQHSIHIDTSWNDFLAASRRSFSNSESSVISRNLYSDDGGILKDGYGNSLWNTKDILVTNEYSIKNTPLFYKQLGSAPISITNLGDLVEYSAFYINEDTDPVTTLDPIKTYVYIGNKIKICEVLADGSLSQLESSYYKIVVSKTPAGTSTYNFTIYIYDDFIHVDRNFIIKYTSATNAQVEEPLSPLPVFYLDDGNVPTSYDESHVYVIENVNNKYRVRVTSDITVTEYDRRDPRYFRYRVYADLNQTLSASKTYRVNIGVIFNDGTTPEINAAKDFLCTLSNSHGSYSIPSNIVLQNPWATYGVEKNSPSYWLLDPYMALTKWLDYDVIIITGCGRTDYSNIAAKIHAFLENGGKLFIENLTNDALDRFIPIFNTNSNHATQYSILDVAVNATASSAGTSIKIGTGDYLSTHYIIADADCPTMRFLETSVVSIPLAFGPSDNTNNWTTIIKDSNNAPIVITKRYNNKGTIIYSNMASIRQARLPSGNTGALKFLSNIIISGVKNRYVSTPWAYSSVMHKNNLFSQEYTINGTPVYIDISTNGTVLAKKILADSPKAALLPYLDKALYSANGTYHIECQEPSKGTWTSATNVTIEYSTSGNGRILAYTEKRSATAFSPYEVGQTDANIVVMPCDVLFSFSITTIAYRYVNGAYKKIIGETTVLPALVRSLNGLSRVGYLSPLLPAVPSGPEWSSRTDVFYEIRTLLSGDFDPKVNLYLYDVVLNKYIYSNDGTIVVSYNDVADNLHNLMLFSQSDIYDIGAQLSKFCIRQDTSSSMIYAALPEYRDPTEKWNLLVHNGSFWCDVSMFDLQKHPAKDALLAQLRDYEIKYDINHLYAKQAFSLMPGYKETIDENARYMSKDSIKVQNRPIFITTLNVENEKLSPIGNDYYATQCKNISAPISITYLARDENGDVSTGTVDPQYYTVDIENGLVHILQHIVHQIAYYISYSYDNIKVIRRSPGNKNSVRERLSNNLGLNQFKLRYSNIATLDPYAPVLYHLNGGVKSVIDSNRYVVDAINGVILFNDLDVSLDPIFADYTYYIQDELRIKMYNKDTGIIMLESQINFSEDIYVSYSYKDDFYIYSGYMDNGKMISLDLNPSDGHLSYQEHTVSNGSIQSGEFPTKDLIGKEIFVYLLPRTKTNRNTGVITNEDNCIRHCVGAEAFVHIQTESPSAILLATISLSNPYDIDDLTLLDTRKRGGGLKEGVDAEKLGYAQYLWDVSAFDGMLYQSNGSIVVRIPKTTLKDNGGRFTTDEIEKLVHKHVPLGVYPIIEYI